METQIKVIEQKYVAYYRVSTKEQGNSALGLDAQKSDVNKFIENEKTRSVFNSCDNYIQKTKPILLEEFIEVESGKNNKREKLNEALRICEKNKATLVIAMLDRLSRNMLFISKLMDSKVKFVCCDMPHVDNFIIHVLAAFAESEAKRISTRTKQGLQAKVEREIANGNIDFKLGSPKNLNSEARILGIEAIKKKALENRNNKLARGYAKRLRSQGSTLEEIATILNDEGYKSSQGKILGSVQVGRLLKQGINKPENQKL